MLGKIKEMVTRKKAKKQNVRPQSTRAVRRAERRSIATSLEAHSRMDDALNKGRVPFLKSTKKVRRELQKKGYRCPHSGNLKRRWFRSMSFSMHLGGPR